MVKVLLPLMALTIGLSIGTAAQASKALAPGDQVMRDYAKSTGYRQWVETLTKYSVPGDYAYLQQAFKVYPDLVKDNSLPKVNFEKDTFQIRDGLSTVTLQYFPGRPHVFAVNGQHVEFGSYELATQKMKKILSAMKKNEHASHFLLLPIAWAAGNGGLSKTAAAVFAVTSATDTVQRPVTSQRISEAMDRLQDTSVWKNFASKNATCLAKIKDVENVVYGAGQLDFRSMECTSMGLKVHLGGVDERGYNRDLVVEKDGFYVEQEPGKKSIISRYELVQPDPIAKSSDDPVALSSSPFQREQMGGEYEPVGGADIATRDRYMSATTPLVRNFCSSPCAGTLKSYWHLLQSTDVKGGSRGGSGAGAAGSH